eukprot:PITA_33388
MTKLIEIEPYSLEEAVEQPIWVDEMSEEYESVVNNSVLEVVPRPTDKLVVVSRWILKVKRVENGSIEKYMARFVSKGYSQFEGINYEEIFSLVSSYSSIRSTLSLVAKMGWRIHQMKVKIEFLNGFIEEEVALRLLIESLMCVDSSVCFMLVISCKEGLAREFEIKDMGLIHCFLGLEIWQGDGELFVSQGKYANKILHRFCMDRCKPMETPLVTNWRKEDAISGEEVDAIVYQQLVGSLMYLVNTRPDMCFVFDQLSQVMFRPTKLFLREAKHVLHYLIGTTQFGLWYRQTEGAKLRGFTNADWAGSPSDRKSTSSGIFSVGSALVSWYRRKHRSMALSSAKSKCMVASQVACEVI